MRGGDAGGTCVDADFDSHGDRIVGVIAEGCRGGRLGVVEGDDVAGDEPESPLSFRDLYAD